MGLDMNLWKKTYVRDWSQNPEDKKYKIKITIGGKPTSIKPERITYIVEEAGYWRKANAIHNWFVENVQDGMDDCREYYVPREKLQELLSIVNKVLASCELVNGQITNGYTYRAGKMTPNRETGQYVK